MVAAATRSRAAVHASSSDGSVYYSRPGTYEVMCKFSGLVAFPFDTLSCALEFGGWALSGGHQGILLDGAGYQFSNQEATSGSSYQEYEISAFEKIRTCLHVHMLKT